MFFWTLKNQSNCLIITLYFFRSEVEMLVEVRKGILCALSHAVQQGADLSVIVFGWQTRCEAELFKAALPPGPFVWRLEVKGRWGLQPAASHPTSDTMFKIGSWFTFADCDQD